MRTTRALVCLLALVPVVGCGGGHARTARGATTCEHVAQPPPRQPAQVPKPTRALDPAKTWRLTLDTSCGSFTITLSPRTAPHATASMVALARAGYFDATTFHRIVPGFVIQGGDPTASGGGGPGYTTVDPPPSGTRYTRGAVAMAKTAAEPRGAGGSQFFVVTGADIGLPPDYALIGRVSGGLAAVDRIAQLGSAANGDSGTPTQPVVVRRATASEG